MAAPAPGSGFLWINYSKLLTKIRALQRFNDALSKDLDVSAAVRGVSYEWGRNFSSEGKRVMGGRGWKVLSKRTHRQRRNRGYPPEHPILVQSGGLRKAAIDYPSNFRARSMNRVVPGSGDKWAGGPTSIRITTSRNRARMVLTGDKVQNNVGGQTPWRVAVPARPFWYVNARVEKSGSDELLTTLIDDVKKLDNS